MEEGAASHNGNYVREFDPEGEFCVDYGGLPPFHEKVFQ